VHKTRDADTKPFNKPRGHLLNSNSAYDPAARARQWGAGFSPAAAAPNPPDADAEAGDAGNADCESPANMADPVYVARLFLGHMSSTGWCTPLPPGAAPFVRTWRQEFHRFDGARYQPVSKDGMVAELWKFLESLYLSLYLRTPRRRPR